MPSFDVELLWLRDQRLWCLFSSSWLEWAQMLHSSCLACFAYPLSLFHLFFTAFVSVLQPKCVEFPDSVFHKHINCSIYGCILMDVQNPLFVFHTRPSLIWRSRCILWGRSCWQPTVRGNSSWRSWVCCGRRNDNGPLRTSKQLWTACGPRWIKYGRTWKEPTRLKESWPKRRLVWNAGNVFLAF